MADDAAPPKNTSPAAGCLMVLGLFVVCVGLMVFNLSSFELVAWLNRGNYVATELEITDISAPNNDLSVWGVVAATGEEIHDYQIPPELMKFDSPSAIVARRPTTVEAKGKRVPIWYNAQAPWLFPSTRVLYRSAYPELPGAGMVLRTALIQAAIIAVGVFCIRGAMKRLRRPIGAP